VTAVTQEKRAVTSRRRRQIFQRRLGGFLVSTETVLGFIFLYAPIIILIVFSFNASRVPSVWTGFTLDWYKSLLHGAGVLGLSGVTEAGQDFASGGIIDAFKNSMIIAISAMLISTVLGTMIALGMERLRFRFRQVLDIMLYLPVVIPEITMGISLAMGFTLFFKFINGLLEGLSAGAVFMALNSALHFYPMNFGYGTIIIGHVAFNISFVAIVVRARLAGMDRALEEAAQDAGANEWQTFRRIVLPLIMPGIIGGALLALTLSLDDFVITFYTVGPGTSTLPLFVYGMIRFEVTPAINAISTLMLAASMVLVALSLVLQRRS
jgi:spermidine/putrescine transport system permease protein